MLRNLKIFGVIFLASSLTLACSKSESQKTQETIDSLNQTDIPRANAITEELKVLGYQFTIWNTGLIPQNPSYENMDKGTNLLNEYIAVGNRILAGAAKPGVIFASKSLVESRIEQSKAMLKDIAAYRAAKVAIDHAEAKDREIRNTDLKVKSELLKINVQIDKIENEDKLKISLSDKKSDVTAAQNKSLRSISRLKNADDIKSAQSRLAELRNSIESFLESAEINRKVTGNPTAKVQGQLHKGLLQIQELQDALLQKAKDLESTEETSIIEGLEFENPFEAEAQAI